MPPRPRWQFAAAGLLGVVLLLGVDRGFERLLPDGALRQVLLLAACNAVVALSLNVINGLAGEFSIGHAGFLALGAYAAAVVASHLHAALGGGEPDFARSFVVLPLALLSGVLVSGFAGFMVGLPSLRLRGDYLAVVTLGFAEIVRLTVASAGSDDEETVAAAFRAVVHPAGASGGPLHRLLHAGGVALGSLGGENGYAGPDDAGVPLYAGPFWVFGLAGLATFAALRIKFSAWGRALRALREDPVAAAAVGVDPTRFKVTSFVLAASLGGLAGGLLALQRDGTPLVQPDAFGFQTSFDAVVMVVVGGSGSVTGALLGSLVVTFTVRAIELLEGAPWAVALHDAVPGLDMNALRMALYAGVLIALMIRRPEGILGEREAFGIGRRAAR